MFPLKITRPPKNPFKKRKDEDNKIKGIRIIKKDEDLDEYDDFSIKKLPANFNNDDNEDDELQEDLSLEKEVKAELNKFSHLWWKMYKYRFFNWALRGRVDDRSPNLSGDSIQIGYSDVFTLTRVTRYFVVSFLPHTAPVALKNHLNAILNDLGFWVRLSMKVRTNKFNIDFSSINEEGKLKLWQERIAAAKSNPYLRNDSALRKYERLLRSYVKLSKFEGKTKEVHMILKLQTRNKQDMYIASDRLQKGLREIGIKDYIVRGNLLDFLRGFMTISRRRTVTVESTSKILMTNRDIVESLPYMQGKADFFGSWMGFDAYNGGSLWLDLRKTSDMKNVLISAESGEGKTYLARTYAIFHNALGDAIFLDDHKGTEFISFTESVGGLIISMTPSKSCYINTFRIPVSEATNESELRALYEECVSISELVFMTLTNPPEALREKYRNIFDDFVSYAYEKASVITSSVATYHNSERLTPDYLYESYEEFSSSENIIKSYGEQTLYDIKVVLHRYWHRDGKKRSLFSREVTIEEINKHRVVCFDYGLHNTPPHALNENELKLKKIYMNYSGSRFAIFNRKISRFLAKVYEEMQSKDLDLLKLIHADFTEGRAKMLINYALGNSSGALSGDSPYAVGIRENISVRLFGRLKPRARRYYVEEYDLHLAAEELDKIAKDDRYKYHFLLDSTATGERVTAVICASMPTDVTESKFFRTVDKQTHTL